MSHLMSREVALVADVLKHAQDDWWLIGGAAFWAHGVQTDPLKDIDVLLSFDDAMRVARKLGLKASSADGTALFRSRFFTQWREPAIPVEFMAELEVKTAHGWRAISPETRQTKTLAGAEVFVPSAQELFDIGVLFGRSKDQVRAEKLARIHKF